MSLTVSNFPQGLSSLLNLRERGRAPNLLSEEYVATIDALPFIMANQYTAFSLGLVVAPGGMNIMVVPPGELWYVHAVGANTGGALAPGVTVRLAPAYSLATGGALTPVGEFQTFAPGETLAIGFSGPLVLGPGGILGALVVSLAGAAPTLGMTATVARLKV